MALSQFSSATCTPSRSSSASCVTIMSNSARRAAYATSSNTKPTCASLVQLKALSHLPLSHHPLHHPQPPSFLPTPSRSVDFPLSPPRFCRQFQHQGARVSAPPGTRSLARTESKSIRSPSPFYEDYEVGGGARSTIFQKATWVKQPYNASVDQRLRGQGRFADALRRVLLLKYARSHAEAQILI